jgi:hypothetical protein
MAFRTARVTVGTTAVQVLDAAAGDAEAWISVATEIVGDRVFLGGDSSVTVSNGFRLENTDNVLNVGLAVAGDDLWAISSGPTNVHVLIRSA